MMMGVRRNMLEQGAPWLSQWFESVREWVPEVVSFEDLFGCSMRRYSLDCMEF